MINIIQVAVITKIWPSSRVYFLWVLSEYDRFRAKRMISTPITTALKVRYSSNGGNNVISKGSSIPGIRSVVDLIWYAIRNAKIPIKKSTGIFSSPRIISESFMGEGGIRSELALALQIFSPAWSSLRSGRTAHFAPPAEAG